LRKIFLFLFLSFLLFINVYSTNYDSIYSKKIVLSSNLVSNPINYLDKFIICPFKDKITILDRDLNIIQNIGVNLSFFLEPFYYQEKFIVPFVDKDNYLNLFILYNNSNSLNEISLNELNNINEQSNFNFTIKKLNKYQTIKSLVYKNKEIYVYYKNFVSKIKIKEDIYRNDFNFNFIFEEPVEVGEYVKFGRIFDFYYGYDKFDKLNILDKNFNLVGKYNLGKNLSNIYEIDDSKFVLASEKGFYLIDSNGFQIVSKVDFSGTPLNLHKINNTKFFTVTNDFKLILFNLSSDYKISSYSNNLFLFNYYDFRNMFINDTLITTLYGISNPFRNFLMSSEFYVNKDRIYSYGYSLSDNNLYLVTSSFIYITLRKYGYNYFSKKDKNRYYSFYENYRFRNTAFYTINLDSNTLRNYSLLQSIPLYYYGSLYDSKDKSYRSFSNYYDYYSYYSPIVSYVVSLQNNLYFIINYPNHTVIMKAN
jgi:hypothetical protein